MCIGRLRQEHYLLVGVPRVPSDKLRRRFRHHSISSWITIGIGCYVPYGRLLLVQSTAPLPIWIACDHGIELLPLDSGHAINLLVKVLGPLLLILYDFLARIAIHVGLGETNLASSLHLLIRWLVLLLVIIVLLIAQTLPPGATSVMLSKLVGSLNWSWLQSCLLIYWIIFKFESWVVNLLELFDRLCTKRILAIVKWLLLLLLDFDLLLKELSYLWVLH